MPELPGTESGRESIQRAAGTGRASDTGPCRWYWNLGIRNINLLTYMQVLSVMAITCLDN